MFKSPLNYTGNKYKLLPQLLPLMPQDIDIFVDLFCGGLDVSLNVAAEKKYCNDIEEHIIAFYQHVKELDATTVNQKILDIVREFDLSITNAEGYNALRKVYNQHTREDDWLLFYVLIAHSFNHQLRFNQNNEFNMPFGKNRSYYNATLQQRLITFVDKIDSTYNFSNQDFREFDTSMLTNKSMVYVDPPYLITTASYNENGGWKAEDEVALLQKLDEINAQGIHFGVSNVLFQGTKSNDILNTWSKKYNVHHLNYDYGNCSYHKIERDAKTDEVFICNY